MDCLRFQKRVRQDERLTSEQGSQQDYEYRRQVTRKNESVKNKRIGKVHEIINTLHKQIDEDILMSQSNPRDIDNNGMQTVVDH
jgi:hypothetical protein